MDAAGERARGGASRHGRRAQHPAAGRAQGAGGDRLCARHPPAAGCAGRGGAGVGTGPGAAPGDDRGLPAGCLRGGAGRDGASRGGMNRRDVVLVVDDTPGTLGVLNEVLEDAGYTVLMAQSAAAAMTVVERVLPDIILIDAVMPGMDGF